MFDKKILFFFEDVNIKIDKKKIYNLVNKIIKEEKKKLISINYIFCSDKFLHKINVESLNHDTLTDVITFNYSENDNIEGEIYISTDRVENNAQDLNIDFENELMRVIAHGVLHLIGYNDKTDDEIKIMRAKENYYIS